MLNTLKIIFEKITKLGWYKKISFWVIIFLAISLWMYITLNETYITTLEVPLNIVPPKGRAIEQLEQQLNNFISVEIEGSGWYLFNYIHLNKTKRCNVNLDNITPDGSLFTVSSLDFQKGLEGIHKIIPRRFYPPRIVITTGEIGNKQVDIKPDVTLKVKDGFVLVGGIYTEPTSVLLTGNKKSLEEINSWKTMPVEFNDVNSSFSYVVNLSDSLGSIIKLQPDNIKVYGEIQQYSEVTFDDIELKIIGGHLPSNRIVSPTNFRVTLMGGIEHLNKINAADIELSVDYDKVINDTIGVLVPNLKIPPFTKIMNVEPKFIYHKIMLPKSI